MLKLVLLLACTGCACAESSTGSQEDPLLSALVAGGAARAALCLPRGGCAGALWARHWLLARASCVARGGQAVRHAPVLLYQEPGECDRLPKDFKPALEAVARFVYPASADPEEPTAPGYDPLDAALVLLSAPGPLVSPNNRSAIYALAIAPELRSWLRYVPAAVPWSQQAPPSRARTLDPAQYRLLDSPLRMLVATVLLPTAALLLAFLLLLRWPESCAAGHHQPDEKLLVPDDNSV